MTFEQSVGDQMKAARAWCDDADPHVAAKGRAMLAFWEPATLWLVIESGRDEAVGLRAEALAFVCAMLLRDLAISIATSPDIDIEPEHVCADLLGVLRRELHAELARTRAEAATADNFSLAKSVDGKTVDLEMTPAMRLRLAGTKGNA
jgi:hypothetical protein